MTEPKARGWTRIRKAAGYSLQGFRDCYRQEAAFRQETWALAVLIPMGIWLGEDPTERALLVASLLLVPIVELLNSSLEAAVDRIGRERHILSGRAKDAGSAAVFLSILLTSAVWGLILLPKWL